MKIMKSLLTKLRSLWYFFYLYSTQGLILLCASVYFFIKVITQKLFEIHSIAQQGDIGLDITQKTYEDTFHPFLLLLLVFVLLYFIFFNTEVIVFRYRFLQLLRDKSRIVFGNKNIKIVFDERLPKTLFLIQGTLVLTNITSGGKKIKHRLKPKSFLQNKEFIFDLSHLPTGKYKINTILYNFKDTLGLFNAKTFSDKESNHEIFIFNNIDSREVELIEALEKYDQENNLFTQMPIENFFHSREYRIGDEIKKIHWKNTAKTGKLIIRLPEDQPQNNDDLNIVLNLFTPYIKDIDQSISISHFLNQFITSLKYLIPKSGKKINIYINGKTVKTIFNIGSINIDHLENVILENSQIQDKRTFNTFITQQKIENPIVFSLSSDMTFYDDIQNFYIYRLSREFKSKKLKALKEFYIYKNENYFGIDIFELLKYYNPIHLVSVWDALLRLRKIIKKNEIEYSKSDKVRYI
jgi:hypothetical protein